MKKIFLSLFGIAMCLILQAQEEDVTHYIKNAGFDEDLTFQADGSYKEIVDKSKHCSGNNSRSYMWLAVDSSVYASPDGTHGQTRMDGFTDVAVNGFFGQINGWTLGDESYTGKAYYPYGTDDVEWVYFGTVPYAIGAKAVPISDNGDSFLAAPSKPENYDTDDNVGFMYLRAGWGGSATYKQVVKLPCAQYRLEYWTINANAAASNGKNMSRVVCRKDVFTEGTAEEAKASMLKTEWTKHEIEFIPTAEFTVEFGFQSEGGSGSNPFLCIDGIKLFKIGEADPDDINRADMNDLMAECQELAGLAAAEGFIDLASYIGDYEFELEDHLAESGEDLEKAVKVAEARMKQIREAVANMENVNAILAKMDNLLQTTDYPGKADFEAAYQKILSYKEQGAPDGGDIIEIMLNVEEEANTAIKAYYISQYETASEENPADFTYLIQNPNLENEDGWIFERGNGAKNTTSGQWYDGSSTNYIDSYHFQYIIDETTGEVIEHIGLVGFKASQLVKDLPNGTYQVGVYTRTPAEGAYVFTAVADTAFVEIPMNYYTDESTGEQVVASDTHGPIWQEAYQKIIEESMSEDDPQYSYYSAIYNANGALGRGWQHQQMEVTVTNHKLIIGTMCGTAASQTEKVFGGNWYSVGGWTLTLISSGDNTGWDGTSEPDANANEMYVAKGIRLTRGGTDVLPISMKNENEIAAFQFDIVLPQGLTINTTVNTDGEVVDDVAFDSRAKSTHIIGTNYQTDGSLRIVGYSSKSDAFRGNDGVLLNIGVSVSENMLIGDYAVELKNVRIVTPAGVETVLPDKTFVVAVGGTPGDANNDDQVTMADVVAIVNHVLGTTPAGFNLHNADVTGDGVVTMADVVNVVNVILGKVNVTRSRSMNMTEAAGKVSLTSQNGKMAVSLDNTADYTAFQMDLTLPAGVELGDITFGSRATSSHSLSFNRLADGKVRVVGWSARNAALKGNSGELFVLPLNVDMDASSVSADHILFTTVDGVEHALQAVGCLDETTGIRKIENAAQTGAIYDLQGRRVNQMTKGLYIIDGKKMVR